MQDNWEWNVGEGLHLWVSINNKKNQDITKYGSKADQNGEDYLLKRILDILGDILVCHSSCKKHKNKTKQTFKIQNQNISKV